MVLNQGLGRLTPLVVTPEALMNTMTRDPIVEEVRKAREKLFRDSGGTIEGLIEHLREAERKTPNKVVTLEEWRRRRGIQSSGKVR